MKTLYGMTGELRWLILPILFIYYGNELKETYLPSPARITEQNDKMRDAMMETFRANYIAEKGYEPPEVSKAYNAQIY